MRLTLALMLSGLPAMLFAQARAPDINRVNPPTLSKPTGYTHVVEASGGKTVYRRSGTPARYFGDTTPASTLVQVVHLARPEFMLEIEVIAVVAP